MKSLNKLEGKGRFVALWVLAGLLEAPVVSLLAGWSLPLPLWAGLLLHALAAVLLFFAPPKERGWRARTRHWGEPLLLLCFLLPGFGWAAAGWLVVSRWDTPHDKEAYRFEEEEKEELTFSLIEDDGYDVLPAVDALHSPDTALKRGAIETLARIRSREAIGWLLRTRADRDPEARFYATSALTRLKRDFETAIQAAENHCYKNPADSGAMLALNKIKLDYAASGMLEESSRRSLLMDCRPRLVGQAERDQDAARLLYRLERMLAPERALDLLERLSHGRADELWLRERAETLYELKRYDDLRVLLKGREFSGDPEWAAARFWWTNG